MSGDAVQGLKLLVVGSTGQLARSLGEAASQYPELIVTALGRPALDLLEPESIARAIEATRPAIVINAAAYTAVDRAESEPDLAFAVNRDGAAALAEITARHDIPLIHVSTDYVFDGRKADAYVESDPPNPMCVYGRSKLAGELRVASANPRHLILRTSWVYSEYGGNFVKTMLRLASERPELRVVGDQHGSPTHAGDLAAAILGLIGQVARKGTGAFPWGVYHLTGGGATTWHGFAERIVAASEPYGRPTVPVRAITTADFPTAAQRPANSQLDCGKAAAVFGITLPHWTGSVDRCVARICAGDV